MKIIKVENLKKEFIIYEKEPGLKGVIKSFYNAKKIVKKAVDDVSFTIQQGEIVGYIGPNGAGKSTTIKMLTGILTPTSGEVRVDGIIPYQKRTVNAKKIGVVFGQRTQLWWDLPLIESFTVLKEIYQISDADYKERLAYFSALFGLDEFIKQPVRQLSLGQRMKADIVASLLHNPKLLFLDEPTIGLDVIAKENIRKTLKEIHEKYQTTIILTTHDLADIEELCDRIMMIDQGKIIYDGSLETIKAKFGSKKIVCFTLKNDSEIDLGVFETLKKKDPDLTVSLENKALTVIFNKLKINVGDIIGPVLKQTEVLDIDISDDHLENIIKAIYKNGL
ncbi:ATP-binding cassette domain-containing protein [Acholeplasma manati]|uniref:ATP-binding cassette domain-containing protein n=1 Tax=Paracholeplasma manati TaxID=591373 RepID=A0ABT2Y535_9MOLU|nr:ATP-binding cassette domain-containing protein [Paracholeplasma manati]MCV2231862.1 ATP-binding cassette domain-containing protein [Paracholeplasma manati]